MNTISWWRTSFGSDEMKYLSDAVLKEHISQGTITAEFERRIADILNIPYVLATTSGSTALLMALIAAGIGPGDEVIVPNRTWIATAHAPLLLGAKVVLLDVEKNRPIMDVTQIEEKITYKTKAIMPVHLNGRSVAMDEINRIAVKYGLKVIEDAAQAFCSKNAYGMLGGQSFAGCFSLSVSKLISTGQGGFIVTKDSETYKRLKLMRTHGVSDVINVSYAEKGFNFRFNDVLASIGLAQLDRLAERISKIIDVYKKYLAVMTDLPYLKFLPVNLEAGEIPLYVEVLCPERARFIIFLADRDIQCRPFYPDLHTASYLNCSGRFPNSEVFDSQGLFLPCGPEQPLENIDRVIDALYMYSKIAGGE
jgi:dTDP-4-amino-4,6-dideoxygalactose transaminase